MAGRTCSVKDCNSRSLISPNLSFHRFPKNVKIRTSWIKFCGRGKKWEPPKNSTICAKHFKEDDFELNFMKDLMNINSRKMLKESVIPSLPTGVAERKKSEKQQIKARKIMVENLLKESNVKTPSVKKKVKLETQTNQIITNNDNEDGDLNTLRQNEALKQMIVTLNKDNAELRNLVENLKTYNNNFLENATKMQEHIKVVEAKNKSLEKELCTYKGHTMSDSDFDIQMKELLSPALTPNQVDIITKRKKKINCWTENEMSTALTLRYFSKRAYMYMQMLNYPLPDLRTLRRHVKKTNLNSGILYDILNLFKISQHDMTERERSVVLMFHEMKVKSIYEYDQEIDEVLGPHETVLVFIARGLFGYWKQPIFLGFDTKVTSALLLEIIAELHSVSYNVVAYVSDYGITNQKIMKELGVDVNKTYFEHPVTQKKVFYFPDAAHLLELLRNNFLDTGFTLQNGENFTKTPLVDLLKLIEVTKMETSSSFQVKHEHITSAKSEKSDLSLALQLFSHETATILKRCIKSTEAPLLAEFIETISTWYDLMNSHNRLETKVFKRPYLGLQEQENKLTEVYDLILSMRSCGKKSLDVFQKGILISIQSLRTLFSEMKERHKGVTFLRTYKLNQDILHNLFTQIRGETEELPTPLNTIHRLRAIMLGNLIDKDKSESTTCGGPKKEEYIVAKVFETAGITPQLLSVENSLSDSEDSVLDSILSPATEKEEIEVMKCD